MLGDCLYVANVRLLHSVRGYHTGVERGRLGPARAELILCGTWLSPGIAVDGSRCGVNHCVVVALVLA